MAAPERQLAESRTASAPDSDDDFLLRTARALSEIRCDTIFDDLTLSVAELLNCNVSLLGVYEQVDGVPSIRALSCYVDGKLYPKETYPLAGTPCETVVGHEFKIYPSGVGDKFPLLAEKNRHISGYAAYPLFDRCNRTLGILSVMKYGEIADSPRIESLLRIFAARAAAEIERNAVADALRASEEQYRAIFNASIDGLLLFKPDGEVVDLNPAMERMYGYSREEQIGCNLFEHVTAERQTAVRSFIDTVLTTGYAHTEDKSRRKDGRVFYADPRGIRMDYRGAPHILAVVRDISYIKAREKALKASEDRLRATVEAALDCIVVLDASGRILEINPAAEACFGYKRDEALGRKLVDLTVLPRNREMFETNLKQFLDTGDCPMRHRNEMFAMRADGSEFPAEQAWALAKGDHGRIFVGFLRDLTEHRAADEQRQVLEGQLRQAQKMEAIGHLTGGIAHDFNNILTSVLGYVQLGAERVREWNDDKLTRYLSRAQRSGERARDLIQQMLTFSRGQQGEPRVLALDSVVDEGLHLLESTLPASIRIERHFARDLPPVMADPLHIEQILVNLCINARDAMASSGVLTVELARTQGRCHHCASCHQRCVDGEFVELVVGDTGPGIDVQLQNRIFEPFFSTKEVGKGSGMGLATVHGIVHEYGGHIVVDSEPGRGTRFRILLPIETAATTVPGARTSTNAPARSDELQGRVLLVDDNFSVGEFLEELLTGWGLEVSNFCDSDKARSLFLAAPQAFDLVILDQTMPQVTGMALAEEFMRVRPDLPVVLYTGYSEAVNEQTAKAAGIRALVRKPLDVAAFRKILSTILHSG